MKKIAAAALLVAVVTALDLAGVSASAAPKPPYPGNSGPPKHKPKPNLNTCYYSIDISSDFRLSAAVNTADNITAYDSFDGSCSGTVVPSAGIAIVVCSSNPADNILALENCGLAYPGGVDSVQPLSMFAYVNTPTNWWACYQAP